MQTDSSSPPQDGGVGAGPLAVEPADAPRVTRIKNLDTGEEYDLEDYQQLDRVGPRAGHEPGPSPDGPAAEDEDGKDKKWRKGTKKLRNWAKNTLTTVRERIEEKREERRERLAHAQDPAPSSDGTSLTETYSRPGSLGPLASALAAQAALAAAGPGGSAGGAGPGAGAAGGAGEAEGASSSGTGGGLAVAAAPTGRTTSGLPIGGDSVSARGQHGRSASSDGLDRPSPASSGSLSLASTSAGGAYSATAGSSRFGPLAAAGLGPGRPPLPPGAGVFSNRSGPLGGAGSAPHSHSWGVGMGPLAAAAAASPSFASWDPDRSSTRPGSKGAASAGAAAGTREGGVGPERGVLGAPEPSVELRVPLLGAVEAGPSSRAVPTTKSFLNQAARVTGGKKGRRQLQQVRLVQEVLAHEGPVWASRFSADARLLATAGRDGVIKLWSVYWYPPAKSSKLIAPSRDPADSTAPFSTFTSAATPAPSRPPLLSTSPLISLPGHTSDVLDLSWSQCRLLLSASADQTARLWFVDVPAAVAGEGGSGSGSGAGRDGGKGQTGGQEGASSGDKAEEAEEGGCGPPPSWECLRSFLHPDLVTACAFHPTNPKVIVTGCADGRVRLWSVPDGTVASTATIQQDFVTRVLFTGDGRRVMAGTLRGKARHYEVTPENILDPLTQLDVKNSHRTGRKVTGLLQVPYAHGRDQMFFITSADSRIRLYVGYVLERKFKGHKHTDTMISAALSPDGSHLICGSDDGYVYIWDTGLAPLPSGGSGAPAATTAGPGRAATSGAAGPEKATKAPKRAKDTASTWSGGLGGKAKEGHYEAFQTPEETTTVALFAPDVCRLGRGLERFVPGAASPAPLGSGPLAAGAAAAAGQSSMLGALILVAGFSGHLYVYENLPATGF
ncbi:hypothetical protein HYH03_000471 [Edaphochlamys debaryana]|uniref:Uncharacterized protein n=1 Tax=Edaphochlamys debaryana TaxID=47281 RepID=A0A835YFQ7_9CHLO|nr:hypothetical protein HYH03_000471 [Edaphochlamys debaryana]|eukprot:KAG2501975.1 hypothetical protein HYH03_000471 [Edaphochlamys debaryana]